MSRRIGQNVSVRNDDGDERRFSHERRVALISGVINLAGAMFGAAAGYLVANYTNDTALKVAEIERKAELKKEYISRRSEEVLEAGVGLMKFVDAASGYLDVIVAARRAGKSVSQMQHYQVEEKKITDSHIELLSSAVKVSLVGREDLKLIVMDVKMMVLNLVRKPDDVTEQDVQRVDADLTKKVDEFLRLAGGVYQSET